MTVRNFQALEARLREARRTIDADLEAHLPSPAASPTVVHDAMRYAALSSGKRLRAIFVLWSCEAGRGDPADAAAFARAIECAHAASLALDDLPSMDGASLRRGQPTLHRVAGEDQAILAAVALLNHGFAEILAAPRLRERTRLEAASRLAAAIGPQGLVGGQAIDLVKTGTRLGLDDLEFIHAHKTGALFLAAGELGMLCAGAREKDAEAVRHFAKNLGLAFQITDDLLDYAGSPETTGKDVGLDRDKSTFVDLCGIDGSRKLVDELIDAAVHGLAPLGKRGRWLEALAEWIRERDR